jgi:hypothetical protein
MTPALYHRERIACVMLFQGPRFCLVRFTDQRGRFRHLLGDERRVLARHVRVLPPAGMVAA